MELPRARIVLRVIVLAWVAFVFAACDRGIEPFDPNETASQPNLDRIYPEGARQPARPESAGMPNPAAPVQRGEPSLVPAGVGPESGGPIAGRVEIDDALDTAGSSDAMLFVIARRSLPVGGPPLAVLRVPKPNFPLAFEIGQPQVMIPGMRFEGEIALSARLDSDGDAMTKLPGDLVGEITAPLPPGSSGVTLVLDRKL